MTVAKRKVTPSVITILTRETSSCPIKTLAEKLGNNVFSRRGVTLECKW